MEEESDNSMDLNTDIGGFEDFIYEKKITPEEIADMKLYSKALLHRTILYETAVHCHVSCNGNPAPTLTRGAISCYSNCLDLHIQLRTILMEGYFSYNPWLNTWEGEDTISSQMDMGPLGRDIRLEYQRRRRFSAMYEDDPYGVGSKVV